MIQLVSVEQLSRAIERARRSNLLVRPTPVYRMYRVLNRDTGSEYTVNFYVRKVDGTKWADCTCLAGQNNQACKHVSASVAVHLGLAAVRRKLRIVR